MWGLQHLVISKRLVWLVGFGWLVWVWYLNQPTFVCLVGDCSFFL